MPEDPKKVRERARQWAFVNPIKASENKKAWYEKNKALQIEKGKQGKAFIRRYLSEHPCFDCGESDWEVLEFDHVRGIKTNNVTALTQASIHRILDEVAKCDVVCANCHRRRSRRRADAAGLGKEPKRQVENPQTALPVE